MLISTSSLSVARLRGTGKRRPILLLAHIDVVNAKREDWSVDPFKFTERDGYFCGRGTTDNKFMVAAFVANLIRYKEEGYTPDRDISWRWRRKRKSSTRWVSTRFTALAVRGRRAEPVSGVPYFS